MKFALRAVLAAAVFFLGARECAASMRLTVTKSARTRHAQQPSHLVILVTALGGTLDLRHYSKLVSKIASKGAVVIHASSTANISEYAQVAQIVRDMDIQFTTLKVVTHSSGAVWLPRFDFADERISIDPVIFPGQAGDGTLRLRSALQMYDNHDFRGSRGGQAPIERVADSSTPSPTRVGTDLVISSMGARSMSNILAQRRVVCRGFQFEDVFDEAMYKLLTGEERKERDEVLDWIAMMICA